MDTRYYRYHFDIEYFGDFDYFINSPLVKSFLREKCKKFAYRIFDFGRGTFLVSFKFSLKEKEFPSIVQLSLFTLFDNKVDKDRIELNLMYPDGSSKWESWGIEDVMPGAFIGSSPVFTNASMDLVYPSFPWQQSIIKTIENVDSDDRSIIFIYDKEGGKGKSTLVKYLVATKLAVLLPWTGNTNQINEYVAKFPGKPAYILDLPRALDKSDKQMFTSISVVAEQIKNGCVVPSMYGGSDPVVFRPPWVFIFMNWPFPNVEKHFSADRIKEFFLEDIQEELKILDNMV